MFSLTPGSKTKVHPKANLPLDREGMKQAKQFIKGVNRFLRYNKDVITEKRFSEIVELRDEFVGELGDTSKTRKHFENRSDQIAKVCKRAKPDFQNSVIKENIEVLFVAVVIAMGIRAYFVQQFKIPTGSMQPTLNGIVAYKSPESYKDRPDYKYHTDVDFKMPNPIKKVIDKVWFGRTYVEWRAKEDDSISSIPIGGGRLSPPLVDNPLLILLPRTYLQTNKGHKYSTSGTSAKAEELLTHNFRRGQSVHYKKGDVIAKGYLETGDMLVVNKLVYHWRKPKRGEVFVFNTRNIAQIQNKRISVGGVDMTQGELYGSQHYIKRLCGLPRDEIQVEPPNLLVNGEPAKEPGIKQVMGASGLYSPGYTSGRINKFNLGPKEYLALGDNSQYSLDSRSWGTVPQKNIVGKAVFVFYPFGNHFGPIK